MGENAVVVFGGAGFIGHHLLRSLSHRGYRVTCADLRPLSSDIPNVESVVCDVRETIPRDLVARSGRVVSVYNLAAVHRTPGHDDREYYDTNVTGAINVAEYCRAVDAERLVFTSSISVYGPSEDEKSETSAPKPESAYGASKLQAEAIHQLWQREVPGRRLTIVRPAVIFGEGENGNFTRLARALRRRMFVYPGRRDTIKACGYVKELVSSLEFAERAPQQSFLFNFCYPQSYTIEEICDAFHDVGGLPRPVGTLPSLSVQIVGAGFDVASRLGISSDINRGRIDKLMRSTRIRPSALLEAGYNFRTDLAAAINDWRQDSSGRFV